MNKFNLHSLPLKNVLEDLAHLMKTEVLNDCEVNTVKLPAEYGEGAISGIDFTSGIGIITYECTFKQEMRLLFNADNVHPAKFLYVTEGSIGHSLLSNSQAKTLTQHQSAIVASGGKDGHVLTFPGGEQVKLCSIEIDRAKFGKAMGCDIQKIVNPLKTLFLDSDSKNSFNHIGNYNLKLFDMLRNLEIDSDDGLSHHLFLIGITAAILKEQINQYAKDLNHIPNDYQLRGNYSKMVNRAVISIKENLENPDNIENLAKTMDTSPAKLQQGFKLIYGVTINAHTKKIRLNKAAEMLVLSNKTVSQIVSEIGLVNRGYFSKIFKERYQITPNAYRLKFEKQYNEKKLD